MTTSPPRADSARGSRASAGGAGLGKGVTAPARPATEFVHQSDGVVDNFTWQSRSGHIDIPFSLIQVDNHVERNCS